MVWRGVEGEEKHTACPLCALLNPLTQSPHVLKHTEAKNVQNEALKLSGGRGASEGVTKGALKGWLRELYTLSPHAHHAPHLTGPQTLADTQTRCYPAVARVSKVTKAEDHL